MSRSQCELSCSLCDQMVGRQSPVTLKTFQVIVRIASFKGILIATKRVPEQFELAFSESGGIQLLLVRAMLNLVTTHGCCAQWLDKFAVPNASSVYASHMRHATE